MLNLALTATAIALAYFALVWGISVQIKNYGLLDAAWSYAIAILAPFYAWCGPGYAPRKWIAAAIGATWSVRLGTYILRRVIKHHPTEDARYETLRQRWPGPGMFLAFFELQALVALIFSLPFLLAAFNPTPQLRPVELIGLGVAVLALFGEALADRQMRSFKSDPANKSKVCQSGLWAYSRHPNYFFEATVWLGFFLFALASDWGWLAVSCPLLMLYFLLKVTGIPLTEEYAIKSKGDAYREYQRTVSAFIPWFRKS